MDEWTFGSINGLDKYKHIYKESKRARDSERESISHEWNQHNGQNLIECNTQKKNFLLLSRTFVCQLLVYGWTASEEEEYDKDDADDDDDSVSKVNDEKTRKWVLIITSELQPVPRANKEQRHKTQI